MLGAAIKAVVETVSALDGESHRSSTEKKFSLLCKMARYVIFLYLWPGYTRNAENVINWLKH